MRRPSVSLRANSFGKTEGRKGSQTIRHSWSPKSGGGSSPATDLKPSLETIAAVLRTKLKVKDRRFRLRTYSQCFLGSEAVDALLPYVKSRKAAVHLGRLLAEELDLFRHVTDGHDLKDDHLFFRFVAKDVGGDDNTSSQSESKEDDPRPVLKQQKQSTLMRRSLSKKSKSFRLEPRSMLLFDCLSSSAREKEYSMLKDIIQRQLKLSQAASGPPAPPAPLPVMSGSQTTNANDFLRIQEMMKKQTDSNNQTNKKNSLLDDDDSDDDEQQQTTAPQLAMSEMMRTIPEDSNNGKATFAVLLQGKAGSGKCDTVKQLLKDISGTCPVHSHHHQDATKNRVILVGNGRFEQHPELALSPLPFQTISHAIAEIVDALVRDSDEATGGQWGERLQSSLDSSLRLDVLMTLVPNLAYFLAKDGRNSFTTETGRISPKDVALLGIRAFRDFFRVLSQDYAIVLSLDDLQFADKESVMFLRTLLEDDVLHKQSFFFVGTHRLLVDGTTTTKSTVDDAINSLRAERIQFDDLTVAGVNNMLSHLLKLPADETHLLAIVIHNKTGGSYYFCIQFIRMLEQRGMLTYSRLQMNWQFDLQQITSGAEVTTNLADVAAEKLRSLSDMQQDVTVLAAALGSSEFEKEVLERLLVPYLNFYGKGDGVASGADLLRQNIRDLVGEGIVLKGVLPGRFRFAHEKVRQVALEKLPECSMKRKQLFLCLGKELLEMVDSKSPLRLFQAAGLLNQAHDLITEHHWKVRLAETNYKAALAASERSSLFPAAAFLEKATDVLSSSTTPEGAWKQNHSLMLQISDLRVRVESQCGRVDTCINVADQIIQYGNSLEEKISAYYSKLVALIQRGEGTAAKQLATTVLRSLGVAFPEKISTGDIDKAIDHVLQELDSKSDDELINMPQASNPNALSILKFYDQLSTLAFATSDSMTGMLCFVVSMKATLEYGGTVLSCISFVQFAILCMLKGKTNESHRFGELSLRCLKERPGVTCYDGRCRTLYSYYVGHWRASCQSFVENMGEVLQQYWLNGDLDNYFADTSVYVELYLCAGLKLDPVYSDIERVTGQIQDNRRVQAQLGDAPLFQFVSNLVGRDEADYGKDSDAIEFHGTLCAAHFEDEMTRKGDHQSLQKYYLFQMIHWYLFGMYKEAHEFAQKLSDNDLTSIGAFYPYQLFYRGMVMFAMAQKHKHNQLKRNSFRKAGKEISNTFVSWVEGGNWNVHHLLLLLKAEELATKKALAEEVRLAYDEAIQASAKLGFLQSRALGNERAGIHFGRRRNRGSAKSYMENAIESYEKWGALAKVNHIQTNFQKLTPERSSLQIPLPSVQMRRNISGRLAISRLDSLRSDSHRSLGTEWCAMSSEGGDSFGSLGSNEDWSSELRELEPCTTV
ncbi:Histidine kinase [Seminavis robusta]|uniref:Histidine kinase n=1 Tax=Seminavis robusta TaxID=568900 RepID=A0A9N8DZI8_9STRA|nr:Histidine kinase [Seminavis robusta]|eukprot:Sro502_g155640.1 Histidine kinase (1385) ;mRNA; r:46635-50860